MDETPTNPVRFIPVIATAQTVEPQEIVNTGRTGELVLRVHRDLAQAATATSKPEPSTYELAAMNNPIDELNMVPEITAA